MYAKIKDDKVVKYPFTLTDLHEENPFTKFENISFEISPEEEIISLYASTDAGLEGNSLVKVVIAPRPAADPLKKRVLNAEPTLEDGVWTDNWKVVDLSQEELDRLEAFKQEELEQLDEEIQFAQAQKATSDDPELWDDYISALQAIPTTAGFPYVDYPARPPVPAPEPVAPPTEAE